jgi:hypothetical protein
VGPSVIFDKSALQALTMDESVWFEAFTYPNLVPVFYVETLADLEKHVKKGKDPESLVGMLATKTPANAVPNTHHRQLVLGEIAGHAIAMDGRPVISTGNVMRGTDGRLGVHVGEFPEQAALLRWQQHEFWSIERDLAKDWRAELAAHDAGRIGKELNEHLVPAGTRFADLAELKAFIDEYCATSPDAVGLAMALLATDDAVRHHAAYQWQQSGEPPLAEFLPFTAHAFTVDLLYYLGVARGFISGQRASNKADLAYLYYLPFCHAFVSGDKLHARTVPLFLRADQWFLRTDELKSALGEFDEHFSSLPDEIKQLGVMSFAAYPPADLDNAITQLWDRTMIPTWREQSRHFRDRVGRPRDEDAERETVAALNAQIAAAQPIAEGDIGDALSARGADYLHITRLVPARKGKW